MDRDRSARSLSPKGAALCSAGSAYVIDHYGSFTGVTVRASSGTRLAYRMDVSDPC